MPQKQKPKFITEGQKLKTLYEWSGLTIEKFCNNFNRTRQWAHKAFKNEIIPSKDKMAISKAYNIPLSYFTGEFELPMRTNVLDDPSASYITASDLEKENRELRKKLTDKDQVIIDLQQKVIELFSELRK